MRLHEHFQDSGTGSYYDLKHSLHVSPEHTKRILQWFNDHDERPDSQEYWRFNRELEGEAPGIKPKVKELKALTPGYGAGEVKIHPDFKGIFDAHSHLPEGWGLVSMLDSGGNQKIVPAAARAHTILWNGWGHFKHFQKKEGNSGTDTTPEA